jgi:hypothetical protein
MASRSGVADQRRERPAHQIAGERLRGVEGAGCLAHARPGLERDRRFSPPIVSRDHARLIVEQRFVHRAQLLDAKLSIRYARTAGAIRCWTG